MSRNTKNNGGLKEMNVNGIGAAGYPAWQGARKAERSKCEWHGNPGQRDDEPHIADDGAAA